MGRSPLGSGPGPELVLWPLSALALPLLPLLVILLSALEGPRRLVMVVPQGQRVVSVPFTLQDGWLGSPRLALTAEIPAESSIELDVALLDGAGRSVLDLAKEGWRASGTWAEDGETGTWEESDTGVTLGLRPGRTGRFQLAVELQELLDGAGRPLPMPIVVRGSLRNHAVDVPLLLFTAAMSFAAVQVLLLATYAVSRCRRVQRSPEAAAGLRLEAAGPGLLRVSVAARWERPHDGPPAGSSLRTAALDLVVSDGLGRPWLRHREMVGVGRWSNDDDHWLSVRRQLYLRLPERDSWRVRVELPEDFRDAGEPWEIEWLQLTLEDGVVTAWPVTVLPLEGAARER
ncbi:hypothetical protein [Synechococcus sp. CCY 9618]|uniref:hypothetical protein n=1 Tax=Synechococcus sp. CCY 9618 TaxID=2815602 RepID=UPI001C236949|nr:hypothetical protein [Synechococcus sp. CCY 9618]